MKIACIFCYLFLNYNKNRYYTGVHWAMLYKFELQTLKK